MDGPMTDDRRPRHRDFTPRRRTQPGGVPQVEIDPELTPPPQAPPGPDVLATMPIVDRIDMIGGAVANLTEAFGKLWDERGNGERIARLEAAVDGYTKQIALHQETIDKFVLPAIKASTARVESLLIGRERTDEQLRRFFDVDLKRLEDVIEKLAESTASLSDRLGKLEFSANQLHASDVTLQAQITKANDTISLLDARLAKLEKHNESNAIATAERSRIWSWARGGAIAAFSAGAAILSNLDDIVRWLG